uniref:Protein acetyllysine N-acetyltransferase n=1 Tax=Leptocylindrus danicus TaxID=163516 RepID=A0A7S2LGK9_9STRA|mmetsp:Transcript_5387/g.7904  ORF Transcript_5387/g.7904 Transcript_5387/m.7904 type:complete len:481 (+) Transcript_5387:208-1650(+)
MAANTVKSTEGIHCIANSNPCIKTLENDVLSVLKSSKRIIVLAGAGMSVSCGIPDFRSADGLYNTLDLEELGLNCPEDLFDMESFIENPSSFYKFAKRLYPGNVQPSLTHKFLALLQKKNKLLRVYTQNIDGLEVEAGVTSKKVVYAHGSLAVAQCLKCNLKFDAKHIATEVNEGKVPTCVSASRTVKKKGSLKRKGSQQKSNTMEDSNKRGEKNVSDLGTGTLSPKSKRLKRRAATRHNGTRDDLTSERSDDVEDEVGVDPKNYPNNNICGGLIKPGVTFFGEKLEDRVGKALEADREKVDALLVIGTSLSVSPMSKVLRYLPPSIPRILINRNEVVLPKMCADEIDSDDEEDTRDGYIFDASLLGNCDDVVKGIMCALAWKIEEGLESTTLAEPCGSDTGLTEVVGRNYFFPGALVVSLEEDEYEEEIVHCDGCRKKIATNVVMKCTQCFDFDLCYECFPKVSKKHYRGRHKFKSEKI